MKMATRVSRYVHFIIHQTASGRRGLGCQKGREIEKVWGGIWVRSKSGEWERDGRGKFG